MRKRLPSVLTPLLLVPLAFATVPLAAQTSLRLRWELEQDVYQGPAALSRVAFTLTNRDTKPLPQSGWAIYFNGLHGAVPGSVTSGFAIEEISGELHRLVPAPGFAGLAPGDSVKIEYLTGLLVNLSFVPKGPYIVFDGDKTKGYALADYAALPFQRLWATDGRGAGVVTPRDQFALDAEIQDISANEMPPVFPTPAFVTGGAGVLRLTAMPAVQAPDSLRSEAGFAEEYLRSYFGTARAAGAPPVRLEVGPVQGQTSPEAYELVVDARDGIRIVGASPAGVFYGLQSLRDLLPPPSRGGLVIPAIRVVDAPRFGYRGLMLDVARNFQPKPLVLRTLDLLARYKLNVLHFHLTDDEGWRVEIPSLPELTSVGGRRGHTLDSGAFLQPAYGSGPDVDRPWGSGSFSRADFIEIVRYAAARHIEVIPELEMPGHARAAIKSMEARFRARLQAGDSAGAWQYRLIDPADTSKYTSAQDFHDNVMNPVLESTYQFIHRVVGDLVATYREAGVPLRHLHMGGDEVPAGVWEGSPLVQAYLKAHSLAGVNDLWYLFYGRVEQILKAQNVGLGGWEEIAVRKTSREGQAAIIPNPEFVGRLRAYVWNNIPGWGAEDLAYRLANGGIDVVLSPASNLYFDLAWNPNPEELGHLWGGFVDLRKPFQFIPFDYYKNERVDRRGEPLSPSVFVGKDRLTDYGRTHILGIQGNLWSETLGADGRLDNQLVPKLLGLAERAWAPDPDWAVEPDSARAEMLYRAAWSRFVNVLGKRELPRLDREVPGINYRIPTPGLQVEGGAVRCSVELPGFTLRYTTDGSEPGAQSPTVAGPIPFRGTISVAAFSTTGRKGHTARVTAPVVAPAP